MADRVIEIEKEVFNDDSTKTVKEVLECVNCPARLRAIVTLVSHRGEYPKIASCLFGPKMGESPCDGIWGVTTRKA